MVGQPCAQAAIARGHKVRGIGRDPAKLPTELRQNLESFVVSSGIYDIPSLDRAVANVDAVICAYGFLPEVLVEGQLMLLRAAERAGVKVNKKKYTSQATRTLNKHQWLILFRFSMPHPGTTIGPWATSASTSLTTHIWFLMPRSASALASSPSTCSLVSSRGPDLGSRD